MAYESPLSKRQLDNMVYIQESGIQFNGSVGVSNTDPIVLDATERFSRSTRAEISENPMADKSDRADNYRVYNPILKFSGVISNDSLDLYSWVTERGEARAQQIVQRLDKLFEEKKLVEIYMPDGLRTSNCLITNLNVSRDSQWANGFYITIEAKQIQLINTFISAEPITRDKNKLEGAKDGGDKAGKTVGVELQQADSTVPILAQERARNPKIL